jgi:hemerythrin-like metal-binding protein
MDNAFQWTAAYSVKVDALDAQHQKLFEIIRELYSAMRSGHGKDIVGNVLRRLTEYTVEHFAAEEKLMEKYAYPQLAQHRVEHRELVNKVLAFKKEFDAGSSAMTPDLMTFLQKWLTNHIQTVDQKYGDFLNSHGVH